MTHTLNQRWAATIVGALVRGGLKHAVIAPGSRSTPLALAFADRESSLKIWSVIDERSAAFFALGLAKGSGTPVAVVCTSGTAGAHFLPAVMEAREGGTPLIILTADRPWELHGFGAPQTIEQRGLFGDYVRGAESLPTPDEEALRHLASVVARLTATARAHPRGAVHLNVPFREPLAPPSGERGPVLDPDCTTFVDTEARVQSSEIADAIARAERGLIVCGPGELDGARVHALASRLGFAVIAEAASNARFGFADAVSCADALLRNERFAREIAPDLVLRFGGGLTPKRPQQWLDECGATIVQVHEGGLPFDPHHRAKWSMRALPEVGTPNEALLVKRNAYRSKWLDAQRAVLRAMKFETLNEPAIANALVKALPEKASLFLSSSMPIRDVDAFAQSDRKLRVFANRGVNGIDGVISTALGVSATTTGPTALLIGDVALLHDLTGWLIARRHSLSLTVVVVNNDGGGIFHFLPIADRSPHFEALFGTPHGVDLAGVANLSGAHFHRPASLSDFSAAVTESLRGGLHLIEVKTDRKENVEAHRALFAKLVEAVP
ncbi:MAG: 2-succinyl-5-enolpyruvyl-6-hydroxy-3-cyclohexene-1-carboxylic-acid synthase [Archangium sp.]|nr:2-succinyl-5-enolpyruvyl-6-hydroxy-3-cyclohexene-1-carboxylic-acid synthase [Archangium sp.]